MLACFKSLETLEKDKKKKAALKPLYLLLDSDFEKFIKAHPQWTAQINGMRAVKKTKTRYFLTGQDGHVEAYLKLIKNPDDLYAIADLPTRVKHDVFIHSASSASLLKHNIDNLLLGWALGAYHYGAFKTRLRKKIMALAIDKNAQKSPSLDIAYGLWWGRDLINCPANHMGPEELEKEAVKLAKQFKAKINVTRDKDLLKKNFPAIYAVGKASPRRPRLIDLQWGNAKHPKITLVGKGVCFDTGGLNIKGGSNMELMKKDMGGAAHVIALAYAIMAAKLPVRLRVLIPAVENSIDGNAMRPSDILTMRTGLTVEVGDTDAEGRLVLADALALACEEKPDLLIDYATLTGAARAALGPDLPALFSNNDNIAATFQQIGLKIHDPLWHMPLWQGYKEALRSHIADICNINRGYFAGAIFGALFMDYFVSKKISWLHFDTYGWNPSPKVGRPVGADIYGVRTALHYIENHIVKPKKKSA